MDYEAFISYIKGKLQDVLTKVPDHNLDEKYLASACRDYCEALRALEQARYNEKRGV